MKAFAALLFVLIGTAAAGVDSKGNPVRKPDIYVYTAPWCPPCVALSKDLDGDRDFRAALMERFTVHVYDYDRHKAAAQRAGVRELPAFFAPEQRWTGYTGKADLARRLNLDWPSSAHNPVSASAAADHKAAAEAEPSPGPKTKAAFDRWAAHERALADQADQLHELAEQLAAASKDSAAVKALQEKLDQLQAERPALMKEAKDAAAAIVSKAPAAGTSPAEPSGGFPWLSIATAAASALGIGGPPAAAAVIIAKIIAGIHRRRHQPRAPPPDIDQAAAHVIVTTEAPPKPQAIIPETRFTTVERDSFADSFAWAKGELGRKEPGAIGTLEALDGLLRQHLSSKGLNHAVRK